MAFGCAVSSSSFSGEAKPFGIVRVSFGSNYPETSGKDGTRLARATVLGAVGIFARANASRSSPLDARDAREAAQKAMSFFRFFLKTHTKRGELL